MPSAVVNTRAASAAGKRSHLISHWLTGGYLGNRPGTI
jgi:hypothetical protein